MTDASARARAAIGLYGDPSISWSVLLEAELVGAVDGDAVAARLADGVVTHPDLGVAPEVRRVEAGEWSAVRAEFADSPYGPGDPLVRAAVSADGSRIALAVHHGAADGLGLLALLGIALGTPVRSEAAGVEGRSAAVSFVRSAAARLREALFAPPTRLRPSSGDGAGDVLLAETLPRSAFGTARLTALAAAATRSWNSEHGARADRVVAGVGASRRGGADLVPDLASTFFRLHLGATTDEAAVRSRLAATPPEPDFPGTPSVLARQAIRALSGRLGSTFLVSNLGVVHAGGLVRAIAFHPCAGGRSGVAFGAATVGGTTTVTLRARRRDFGPTAAADLLGRLLQEAGLDGARRG